MGCDIHLYVEKKVKGKWVSADTWKKDEDRDPPAMKVPYESRFYRGRNYDLFAILADVRNGTGFAGIKTNESRIIPMDSPRGFPSDASPEVAAESESWDGDGHSHSYFTLEELMAYDWTLTVDKQGWVNRDEYLSATWNISHGEGPDSYSGDVSGNAVAKVTDKEMANLVKTKQDPTDSKSYYCLLKWTENYMSRASEFLGNTIPRLWRLGRPEDVRIVFWFDN